MPDTVSTARSPPRLLVIGKELANGERQFSAFILADTLTMEIKDEVPDIKPGVCQLLCQLLACYFAWDLSYPKQYQLLAFLHKHLLGDRKEKLFKSATFMKIDKLFNTV